MRAKLLAVRGPVVLFVELVRKGKGVMPSYSTRLTTKQIDEVAAFVATSSI